MTKQQAVQLFEEKKIRSVWDDEQEKWYFSVADVVEVLTESANPTDYIKKMKKRDPMLAEGWGQIVTPLSLQQQICRNRIIRKHLKKMLQSHRKVAMWRVPQGWNWKKN